MDVSGHLHQPIAVSRVSIPHAQARLSRFQGANAISSADFYDNGEGGGSGPARAGSDFDITAGDLVNRLSMQVNYHADALQYLRRWI